MSHWHERSAKSIPDGLRKTILEEGLIDKAKNIHEFNTPMEFLFDVYEEFIDVSGELDDFSCFKCRQKVLDDFVLIKPYLEKLENGT